MEKERDEYLKNKAYQRNPNNGKIRCPQRSSKSNKKTFVNVICQRCQMYFLINILSKTPKKNTEEFRAEIEALFKIQDVFLARKMKDKILVKNET